MSLSKSKCWYSNNCLHFVKRTVPLKAIAHSLKVNNAEKNQKDSNVQILSLSNENNKVIRGVLAPSSHCSFLIEPPPPLGGQSLPGE